MESAHGTFETLDVFAEPVGNGANTTTPDCTVSTEDAVMLLAVAQAINFAQTSAAGTFEILVVLLAVPVAGNGASTIAPLWIVRTVVAGVVLVTLQAINFAQTSAAGTLVILVVLLAVPVAGSGAETKLPDWYVR
jgi:hypothetical protein